MSITRVRRRTAILSAGALALAANARAGDVGPDLGRHVSESEVRARSITVYPDGRNLPPGRGTAREGAALYGSRCASCHGATGMEGPASRLVGADGFFEWTDPLRIVRIMKQPQLVLSVGGQWPYATSIFDYVRRAMPHLAPKSLTHDEVYALTAHILYLNGLLGRDEALGPDSLAGIEMPGRSRSVSLWPEEGER